MGLNYDFANILFAGPCNRFCPWCIGKKIPSVANENNLNLFPPKNLESFIDAVNKHNINQVVFTGTTTDPQLYRHEAELLKLLRKRLHSGTEYSLHSNGVLALRKIDLFNQYDKACISFPSFIPETYEKLMGSRQIPDLASIIKHSRIPIKVSCIINDHNAAEINQFLSKCHAIGIKRIVLRRLVGDSTDRNPFHDATPRYFYKANPVYDVYGMEVTYWHFDSSTTNSINLFANGTLGTSYLLTETREFQSYVPQDSQIQS